MTDIEAMALGWAATASAGAFLGWQLVTSWAKYRRSRNEFLDCMNSMRNRLYDQQDEFNRDFNQLNRSQKELLEKNAMLRMHVENLRKANETLLTDNKKRLEDVFKACDEIAGLKHVVEDQKTSIVQSQNTVDTLTRDLSRNSDRLVKVNNELCWAGSELESLRKVAAEYEQMKQTLHEECEAPRYFVNLGQGTIFCGLQSHAIQAAQTAINDLRRQCDPEWPEEVENVCWGPVRGEAEQVELENGKVDYVLARISPPSTP